MSPTSRIAIRREAEMVRRFTLTYRARVAELIARMNNGMTCTDPASLSAAHCCLEAVDLLLSSHAEFARAFNELADEETLSLRKAA